MTNWLTEKLHGNETFLCKTSTERFAFIIMWFNVLYFEVCQWINFILIFFKSVNSYWIWYKQLVDIGYMTFPIPSAHMSLQLKETIRQRGDTPESNRARMTSARIWVWCFLPIHAYPTVAWRVMSSYRYVEDGYKVLFLCNRGGVEHMSYSLCWHQASAMYRGFSCRTYYPWMILGFEYLLVSYHA